MDFQEVSFETCRVDLVFCKLVGSSNKIETRLYKLQYDDKYILN